MPKKLQISVETKDPLFFSRVSQIHKLNLEIKERENIVSTLTDQVKEVAKGEWCRMYEDSGINPGSVKVYSQKDGEVSSVLFVPSDRYISLNETTKSSLTKDFGEEVVQESREWSISSGMVEKYLPIIKEMIKNSSEILEEDKSRIFTESVKYSVKPGTIDNLPNLGQVEQVFERVRPVVSLKNIQVQKNFSNSLDI